MSRSAIVCFAPQEAARRQQGAAPGAKRAQLCGSKRPPVLSSVLSIIGRGELPSAALPLWTLILPRKVLLCILSIHAEVEVLWTSDRLSMYLYASFPPCAGHVPLRIIAERILAHHATDQFGDFRGTLLGLLAAYAYESSILAAATRLVSSDAFHALFSLYQSHTRFSQPLRPDEDVGTSGHADAAEASGSESSGAGPSSSHAASGTDAPEGSRVHRQHAAGSPVSWLAAFLWDTPVPVDN